jgi:hypothetical protein
MRGIIIPHKQDGERIGQTPLLASPTHAILSGMPDRKKRDHKPASPDGEVIAKAERRFAQADKQRARIKADPRGEISREQSRVKTKKPDA